MQPIEIIVRRKCRHLQLHPHHGFADDSGRRYYCSEGDSHVLSLEELQTRLFAVLAEQSPRVPIDDSSEKAAQIVVDLSEMLREGALAWND